MMFFMFQLVLITLRIYLLHAEFTRCADCLGLPLSFTQVQRRIPATFLKYQLNLLPSFDEFQVFFKMMQFNFMAASFC